MKSNILGSYLKKKRIEADMSQAEVAKLLGYGTSQYISNFERGACAPSLKILNKLSKAFKVDIREFFDIVMEQRRADVKQVLFAPKRGRRAGRAS
ncbi:MAG: helix-turn-helix transcriptional regulator [Bdellovibrionaceae bacterium]|nr:helix-turn-helix transcriptional regulator [Pseudobdellovibrionaceae bacterium]MBX3032385.1 helix-turn-helix transcriptional regulator [Pseudobdellovibrionaceae bacterium]